MNSFTSTAVFFLFVFASVIGYAQLPTRLVITARLKTDNTFHIGEKLLLHLRVRTQQVTYTLNSKKQVFKTNKRMVEDYHAVYDGGDKPIRKRETHFYIPYRNRISVEEFKGMADTLKAGIDTPQYAVVRHTSHYYPYFSVVFIQGNDTTVYSKTDFCNTTGWKLNDKFAYVVNQKIDKQIAGMLPPKFLLLNRLANPEEDRDYEHSPDKE